MMAATDTSNHVCYRYYSKVRMLPVTLKPLRAKLPSEPEHELLGHDAITSQDATKIAEPSEGSRKNATMQVIRVTAAGQSSTLRLKRSEVLKMTHEAASLRKPQDERKLSPRKSRSQLLPTGNYNAVQPVHSRDLRKLDAAFAANNDPYIMVRKQAIVVSTDSVRAIIMRDACLLFQSGQTEPHLPVVTRKLSELSGEKDTEASAYEFRALEAVLYTVCKSLTTSCETTIPQIMIALEQLARSQISATELETLRSLKNTINDLSSQVECIRRVLMELLDSESELRLMYLTHLYDDPDLLTSSVLFDPEEAEGLLESYLQEIHTLRTKIKLLQQRIVNTESLVMLKLDSTRNHLLTVDVVFSLVTLSLTLGMFITAAFGMNLRTGLEEHGTAFAVIAVGSALACLIVVLIGLLYFRSKGVLAFQ